jgi:hypothetical protein
LLEAFGLFNLLFTIEDIRSDFFPLVYPEEYCYQCDNQKNMDEVARIGTKKSNAPGNN